MNSRQTKLIAAYAKLEPRFQQIVQLTAVLYVSINRTKLVSLADEAGIRNVDGSRMVYKEIRGELNDLFRTEVLRFENANTGPVIVHPTIVDYVFQETMMSGHFMEYNKAVTKAFPTAKYSHDATLMARGMRNAFYLGDLNEWQELSRQHFERPELMSPFRKEVFRRLTPDFQCIYCLIAVSGAVATRSSRHDRDELAEIVASVEQYSDRSVPLTDALLDLFIAKGDVAGLQRLRDTLTTPRTDVSASLAFLTGDFDGAFSLFQTALKELRKRTKRRTAVFLHLPSLLFVALLLRDNKPKSQSQARAILKECSDWRSDFGECVTPFADALEFQISPLNSEQKHRNWHQMPPLFLVAVGWAWRWFYSDKAAPFRPAEMKAAAKKYRSAGLDWLAAECDSFMAALPDGAASEAYREQCSATHERLGTVSLADFIQLTPLWERTLDAIENLIGVDNASSGGTGSSEPMYGERMIWELTHSSSAGQIQIEPFLQKLNSKGWTKGRKVALHRIYEHSSDSEYAFLSDQDRAICRSLRQTIDVNMYGYREKNYEWDMEGLAKTLVGHPLIFSPGDRTTPIEITRSTPGLTIQQTGDEIQLAVSPENNGGRLVVQKEAANRISIVEFSKKQSQLAEMVATMPSVPAEQHDRIAAVIQSLSSVIAVQSDLEGTDLAGEMTEPNSNISVQMTPYQEGLRAELFVQPLGEHGPFCRPGVGAASVFATVDGKPQATRRDLDLERKHFVELLAHSHQLEARTIDNDQTEWLFHDAEEALELVTELQALASEGKVTVLWPRGKTHDVAGQATSAQFRVSIRRDRDWFSASGKLKVDDELTLDMMKLLDLISDSPSRFVKLDDGRFLALTADLRQRIAEIASYGSAAKGKIRFAPIRALAMEELIEATNAKTDKHWKEHITLIEESASVDTRPPTTLQTELRDYQQEGFGWMKRLAHWNSGACLADDMGLGKTIQALALGLDRAVDGPALVVAPASVGFNWESEVRKFAPTLTPKMFRDWDRERFFAELGPGDIAITSYGMLQSEIKRFAKVEWNTIFLDEAQAIKNMETKRSQAVMKLQGNFRVILTGTPLENHLGEMWNLFRFITPGLLGSNAEFRERFALPIERDQCRQSRNRLKKLIQPFLLRRTKTEVLSELPSRSESVIEIEMSPAEVALYEALRRKALEKFAAAADDKSKKGEAHLQVLAELTRLRLACCHPSLVGGDDIVGSKLEMFRHKIREIVEGHHKVLVFSQFVKHLSILRAELDAMGVSYQYLDGSTPTKKRKGIVESFQAGEGDVFLISLKAGGTGLNLTAADYVIHMDPWWNPAVEDQATDRAHRIGQSRPVNVYRFITKGTIEERIVALHQTKRDLADSLLAGTSIASKLSTDDLIRLLRDD